MTFMVYSATDLFAVSPVRHTVLDTMACGITVISHAIPGIPDTLRNTVNGLMVRATGAGALADAIRRFLNNKARCTGARTHGASTWKSVHWSCRLDAMPNSMRALA